MYLEHFLVWAKAQCAFCVDNVQEGPAEIKWVLLVFVFCSDPAWRVSPGGPGSVTNQRPVLRSHDPCWPIRGQFGTHSWEDFQVSTLGSLHLICTKMQLPALHNSDHLEISCRSEKWKIRVRVDSRYCVLSCFPPICNKRNVIIYNT